MDMQDLRRDLLHYSSNRSVAVQKEASKYDADSKYDQDRIKEFYLEEKALVKQLALSVSVLTWTLIVILLVTLSREIPMKDDYRRYYTLGIVVVTLFVCYKIYKSLDRKLEQIFMLYMKNKVAKNEEKVLIDIIEPWAQRKIQPGFLLEEVQVLARIIADPKSTNDMILHQVEDIVIIVEFQRSTISRL